MRRIGGCLSPMKFFRLVVEPQRTHGHKSTLQQLQRPPQGGAWAAWQMCFSHRLGHTWSPVPVTRYRTGEPNPINQPTNQHTWLWCQFKYKIHIHKISRGFLRDIQYPAKKLAHGLLSIRPHAKFFFAVASVVIDRVAEKKSTNRKPSWLSVDFFFKRIRHTVSKS